MGLQLRADQAKPYIHVLYVATFAAMSSIGIAIGLAVSSATGEDTIEGKSYEIATATMQGEQEINQVKEKSSLFRSRINAKKSAFP